MILLEYVISLLVLFILKIRKPYKIHHNLHSLEEKAITL